jgi:DNA polymerase (family 10)
MSSNKEELIGKLTELSILMELNGDNPFKCRAHSQAARVLEGLDGRPGEWIEDKVLPGIKGLGKGLIEKIEEWVETGELQDLNEYRRKTPAGLLEMMKISGLGPKKIKLIWKEKKIESLDQLEKAARSGELDDLPRFSRKTSENILKGIEQRRLYNERHHISTAGDVVDFFIGRLSGHPSVSMVEVAGSFRRRRETIKDIDLLVISADPAGVMDHFISTDGVIDVVAHGETKSSILYEGGVPVDLRVVPLDACTATLNYFTGSSEHNTEIRGRASKLGFKLNEYGLYRLDSKNEEPVALENEDELYRILGLEFIEPELRENMDEIEAASKGKLPHLIETSDIRGVIHCHSTWSDGKNTILEMARTADRLGYDYFCICDHSQSAAYAGGLKPDDVKRQWEEIERLNDENPYFPILKGIESDILADGSLDYSDELLVGFEMVVASVHSQMNLGREEMTGRICRAIEHPCTRILGHPTGRLLLRREPYELDLDRIFECAASHHVAIEINANPMRLDLDWRYIRKARNMGCRFAINPDAHNTRMIEDIQWGVGIARKGWLEREDVINSLIPDELMKQGYCRS